MRPPDRPIPREMRIVVVQPNQEPPPETIVRGRCWVVDGDTIVIDKMHIRLAGIDAPELDHPWGQQSKWTLVKLCKGQTVTAHIKPEMSYDRLVAQCFLPDGRDLAAELVKVGLALDWPKFSGGKYRHLEPADARKKLWRASLRQGGVMWPSDDMLPAAKRPEALPSGRPHAFASNRPSKRNYRVGWLIVSGFLVLLAGCHLAGGGTDDGNVPVGTRQEASAFPRFRVTANALNVRAAPAASATVLTQIAGGTTVTPTRMSGSWYGIEIADGRTGWVHGSFLSRLEE